MGGGTLNTPKMAEISSQRGCGRLAESAQINAVAHGSDEETPWLEHALPRLAGYPRRRRRGRGGAGQHAQEVAVAGADTTDPAPFVQRRTSPEEGNCDVSHPPPRAWIKDTLTSLRRVRTSTAAR